MIEVKRSDISSFHLHGMVPTNYYLELSKLSNAF
jgi:hypothetical protein